MDNSIFRFRNFPVYNDAREFSKSLKKLIKEKFPKDEKFRLISQMFRALDSIVLNIAEGTERYTDLDFSHFLNNALTSLNEVIAALDVAFDDEYITKEECELFMQKGENIYRQLRAFSAKVRKDNKRS